MPRPLRSPVRACFAAVLALALLSALLEGSSPAGVLLEGAAVLLLVVVIAVTAAGLRAHPRHSDASPRLPHA